MPIFVVPSKGVVKSIRSPNERIETHQIIKQLGLEFLQVMHSEDGPGTDRIWTEDPQQSEIMIVDKYTFNLDDVNVRPAIVANRGPQRWGNSSGISQLQEMDPRTAKRIHTDLINGSVIFNCFAKDGIEAETIAGNVFDWFRVFRIPLRKSGFFKIDSAMIGEEALVKSDSTPDLSVVPVQVNASIQVRWSIEPRATRLRAIKALIGQVTL